MTSVIFFAKFLNPKTHRKMIEFWLGNSTNRTFICDACINPLPFVSNQGRTENLRIKHEAWWKMHLKSIPLLFHRLKCPQTMKFILLSPFFNLFKKILADQSIYLPLWERSMADWAAEWLLPGVHCVESDNFMFFGLPANFPNIRKGKFHQLLKSPDLLRILCYHSASPIEYYRLEWALAYAET